MDEGMKPGYYLECRYNYLNKDGELTWTSWFLDRLVSGTKDEKAFKEAMNEYKERLKNLDKITKRKHECRITEINEENDPCKELVELTRKYRELDKKKEKKNKNLK